MKVSSILRTSFLVLVLVSAALADDSTYQKGTLTSNADPHHKSYNLKAGDQSYQISYCGEFQDGQAVDFRVKDDKIYIAHPGAKEYKCSILSMTGAVAPGAVASNVPTPPTYLKGTIEGYETRRDVHVSGAPGGPGTVPATHTTTRVAKVYELHGSDLIYKVDYCGAFQAGKFSPGQVIEYRVDGDRLYVRHDINKEYSCQIEGRRALDKPVGDNPPPATSPSPAASPQ